MRLLRLEKVLAATDCTPTSDAALAAAGRLAAVAEARLHVIHAVPSGNETSRADRGDEKLVSGIEATLERLGAHAKYEIDIMLGRPADSISRVAERIGADLIVLGRGATPAGADAHPVGSTAYAVVTRSTKPCLVIRRPARVPLRCALVGIDTSEAARGALLVALSWTSALRSRATAAEPTTLTALHVAAESRSYHDSRARRIVEREIEQLRTLAGEWAGITVESVTVEGADVAATIARQASEQHCDLVVLGTRGLGDSTSGLGSVSAEVVRRLDAPILLVPPAVWRQWSKDFDVAIAMSQA
jgi:nucleotide-binding universal stress UspA family protein